MQLNRVINLKITEEGDQVRCYVGIAYDGTGLIANSKEFHGFMDDVMVDAFVFLHRDKLRIEQMPENPPAPDWLKEPAL